MHGFRDQRPYNLDYYRRNREAEIARVKRRQEAPLTWLRDLRRVPCADCGRSFAPYVMDFDHRDPTTKKFSLAAGKSLLKNRDLIAAEIAKCDIVCANCHRIRTHLAQVRGDLPGPPHEKKESTPERLRGRAKFKEARGAARRSAPCLPLRAVRRLSRHFPLVR
jgi:hypothetical protein